MHLLLVNQGEKDSKEYIPERLTAAGHRVDLLHWSSQVWSRQLFGRTPYVRYGDPAGLAALAETMHAEDPFDGVLCYDEATVPLADRLAKTLALPSISSSWGDAYRYKDRTRVALEAAGLPVPRYQLLRRPEDFRQLATWRFPLVLKPVAMMGSRGVVRVDDYAELPRLAHVPFSADEDMRIEGELWSMAELFDIPRLALAEEYVSGPEYSAEGEVAGGAYRLFGIAKKISGPPPYFDEVAHVFPAPDLDQGDVARVREVVAAAHRALGLRNAMTHTEFRLAAAGVVIMEVNARLAGGHIPDLVEAVTGCDLVERAVARACGVDEPALQTAVAGRSAAAVFLLAAPDSWGTEYQGSALPELKNVHVEHVYEYFSAGAVLPTPRSAGTVRVGCAILTGDHGPDLLAAAADIHSASRDQP
jgi:biotin carboxylase